MRTSCLPISNVIGWILLPFMIKGLQKKSYSDLRVIKGVCVCVCGGGVRWVLLDKLDLRCLNNIPGQMLRCFRHTSQESSPSLEPIQMLLWLPSSVLYFLRLSSTSEFSVSLPHIQCFTFHILFFYCCYFSILLVCKLCLRAPNMPYVQFGLNSLLTYM